jgi:hypothetical protein
MLILVGLWMEPLVYLMAILYIINILVHYPILFCCSKKKSGNPVNLKNKKYAHVRGSAWKEVQGLLSVKRAAENFREDLRNCTNARQWPVFNLTQRGANFDPPPGVLKLAPRYELCPRGEVVP